MVASHLRNEDRSQADSSSIAPSVKSSKCMDTPTEVSVAAESGGDGSIEQGVTLLGEFLCPHCSMKFEIEKSLNLRARSMDMRNPLEDIDTAKSGNGPISKGDEQFSLSFQCPHCIRKFRLEKVVNLHDKRVDVPWVVRNAARSGDGSLLSAIVRFSGKIQCPDCTLKFDSERALNLHSKFIHQSNGGSPINGGYELRYEFKQGGLIAGNDDSFGTHLKAVAKL